MKYLKMNHFKKYVRGNKGILLIEIIVSVGIAGILMLSLLSMMQLVNQNSSRVTFGVTKNELINRIRNNAVNLFTIENSADLTFNLGSAGLTPDIGDPNNLVNFKALADCIPNVGAGSCDKSTMENTRGFRFYLTNGISDDPLKIVAGEDVFYTISGMRCSQTQAANPGECPIKAEAWAEPFCTGFATTCNKAISLTVRYKVSLRSDYTGNTLMAPIEGEIYLPLTKGIQLTRLLSQNDTSISMNTYGIYAVQKHYGLADQATQPTGLRFEAIMGNPTGLVSMKLQYRMVTGVDAKDYLDNALPPALGSKSWEDVPDPLVPCGTPPCSPWSVNLTGAKPNEIINFGTQTMAGSAPNTSKDFKIGGTTNVYNWHYNAGVLTAPSFKSGFYQFRVLATDADSNTMESMNYITVRIVPRPQIITSVPNQPALDQYRNCISGETNLLYKIAVADDENLGVQSLTLDGTPLGFSQISGTFGEIPIDFDISQNITGTSKNFMVNATVSNSFTGKNINFVTLGSSANSFMLILREHSVFHQDISSTPNKIRIDTNGTAYSGIEMGSCCNQTPTANWDYLKIPEVGDLALLSGNNNSSVSCAVNASTKKRYCSTSVTIKGEVESPAATGSNDIKSTFTFSGGNNACSGGSGVNVSVKENYIPVVKIPGIQFFTPESLWLDLPNNPILALKTYTPKVYVRIDFDPDQDVEVGIYQASNNAEICKIKFLAGSDLNPKDVSCNIPLSYSGDLTLKKVSNNIMLEGDTPNSTFRAKLVSGKLNHRTCQPKLTDHPEFAPAPYVVTSTQPMLNSPWGYNEATLVQDPQNDTGLWNIGELKTLRCYDRWAGSIENPPNTPSPYSSNDQINFNIYGLQDVNVQDSYMLTRYNSEPSLRFSSSMLAHTNLGASSGGRARYQTYIFPDNPSLDFYAKNAPWAFVVWNNGAPASAHWQYLKPGGATATTPTKPWTDLTPDLCKGSATLSKVKLYGVKTMGHSTAEAVMKATNNIYTIPSAGYYSYHFMCAYGRWNPFHKSSTVWSH